VGNGVYVGYGVYVGNGIIVGEGAGVEVKTDVGITVAGTPPVIIT